jgi:hypothetical protein
MTGQPVVSDMKLSFLPHLAQPLTGGPVSVAPGAINPGFLTTTDVTHDPGLQAIVRRRVLEEGKRDEDAVNPQFRKMRFALVDLTGPTKLLTPQFAGRNETVQGGLGSMAKMSCMYAAYQLKFDLEQLSKQAGISDEQALFKAARDRWNDTQKRDTASVTQLFASGPKIELLGKLIEVDSQPFVIPRPFSAPDLEQIFTTVSASGGGLTLRFKGSDLILVDPSVPGSPPDVNPAVTAYVNRFAHGNLTEVRKLTFAERMFLMIDNSDNPGAHTCIENVSFLYITSGLWQMDFYSPQRGGGLWEGSTHDGAFRWKKPPVPRDNPDTDFVSATPAGVAALLTLMEQGRLVSANSCAGMKQMMNKFKPGLPGGSFTRSYFEEGLRRALLPLVRINSKLGIGVRTNDGAIILRDVPDPLNPGATKQIRYVAAGFDDPTDGDNLHALVVAFDKCIRENNSLLSSAVP